MPTLSVQHHYAKFLILFLKWYGNEWLSWMQGWGLEGKVNLEEKRNESEFWRRFVFSTFIQASESSFTRTMFSSNIFSMFWMLLSNIISQIICNERYFKYQLQLQLPKIQDSSNNISKHMFVTSLSSLILRSIWWLACGQRGGEADTWFPFEKDLSHNLNRCGGKF